MSGVLAQAGAFRGPEVQWFALSPLLVLLGGAVLLLVVSALLRGRQVPGTSALVTVTTAAAAMVLAFFLWEDVQDEGPRSLVGGALGLDGFAVFVTIAICAAVILASLLADDYLRRERLDSIEGVEFHALLLLCAVGGVVMAGANDLIVLFLGLETLSLGLYVLAASHLRRFDSQESAIKYFVLGGFSSAFLLYGIALVYGATGSTNMARIADILAGTVLLDSTVLYAGMALILVGLAFKVAAVPFHSWTPDVYQGAPTPVTGFMASAAKAAGFAALLRVFYLTFETYSVDWRPVVFVLAVLTLVVGSVLAVVQTNAKRMLAYSSISHAGFILVAVQAGSARGTAAALFYLLAYTFMVLGTFGILTVVGRVGDDEFGLDSLRGLSRRKPLLAFVFAVLLFAQAGVPFTSGFVAKFYVIAAAVDAESYALAIVAMLAAVVAAFLYLRIIVSMYLTDDTGTAEPTPPVPISAGVALTVAFAFTVIVGFAPGVVIDFARDAIPVLVASG